MMLWDIIRDFFVKYIFGGLTSEGEAISTFFGQTYYLLPDNSFGDNWGGLSNELYTPTGLFFDDLGMQPIYTTLADYLSTTATIIVMVLLCFLLVKLAIWIFKLGANLIRLR